MVSFWGINSLPRYRSLLTRISSLSLLTKLHISSIPFLKLYLISTNALECSIYPCIGPKKRKMYHRYYLDLWQEEQRSQCHLHLRRRGDGTRIELLDPLPPRQIASVRCDGCISDEEVQLEPEQNLRADKQQEGGAINQKQLSNSNARALKKVKRNY